MIWIAVVCAILGACFATLNTSLRRVPRMRLEHYLAKLGRGGRAEPIFDAYESHVTALAMARSIFTVAFVLFVLLEAVAQTDPEAGVHTARLIWALVIILAWMLIFVTAIPSSIASHAAVPVVAQAITLIRATRIFCLPILAPLQAVDEIIKRLAGEHAAGEHDIDEQIMSVISEGEREGKVDEAEKEMIEGVVELRGSTVEEIMTPRIDIEGIELTDDLEAIKAFITNAGHSRIPVFEDDLDHIIGVLYAKDLIPYVGIEANGFSLRSVLRDATYIPETKPIHELLAEAQQTNIHIAIVVDEYGGTSGLVTVEDIVEEIVGEIRDEYETEEEDEPTLERIDEHHATADARLSISDLNDEWLDDLGCPLSEDEDYETLGGFIFAQLGHVPEEGEIFVHGHLRFTVTGAEKTRVVAARIEYLTTPEPQPADANGNGNGRSGHELDDIA